MMGADGTAAAARDPWGRFLIGFMLAYAALFTAARIAQESSWLEGFNEWTAAAAVGTARLLDSIWMARVGAEIHLYGGRTLVLENGCNGIDALTLLLAGIVAFPCAWRARASAAVLGVGALLLVNHVRLVALITLANRFEEWFDHGHLFIGQTVVVVAVCAGWFLWASRVRIDGGTRLAVPHGAGDREVRRSRRDRVRGGDGGMAAGR